MLEVVYATAARLSEEPPTNLATALTVKFNGSLDENAAPPVSDFVASASVDGDTLTVIGTHRQVDDLYAEVIAHLKRYDIIHRNCTPPVLSAKPEPRDVVRSTPGPTRMEQRLAGASS